MPKSTFSDAYGEIPTRLIELRRAVGVTQVELAKRLAKPQSFVSNFERGIRRIDVLEFYAIVVALGGDPVATFAAIASRLPKRVTI